MKVRFQLISLVLSLSGNAFAEGNQYGLARMLPSGDAASVSKAVERTDGAGVLGREPRREAVDAGPVFEAAEAPRKTLSFSPTVPSRDEKEIAIASLESQNRLEEELRKVRRFLAGESMPEEVTRVPVEDTAASVEVNPASPSGRLIASLQNEGESRAGRNARIQRMRDSLGKKDLRYMRLTNASLGTSGHASLLYNRVRGSSRGSELAAVKKNPREDLEAVHPPRRDTKGTSTLGFVAPSPWHERDQATASSHRHDSTRPRNRLVNGAQ